MGYDINCWAEVREGGVWRKVGAVWPDQWGLAEVLTDRPFTSRCYPTFAILAGVGTQSERFTAIALPRGFPPDLSSELKAYTDQLKRRSSPSWHSLRSLLEYPAWQVTKMEELLVDGEGYSQYGAGVKPRSWGGRMSSRRIVREDVMQQWIAKGTDTRGVYTRIYWPTSRLDAEEFVTVAIPRLLALASPEPCVLSWAEQAIAGDKTALVPLHDWLEEHGRPGLDDVRMVFFFDN